MNKRYVSLAAVCALAWALLGAAGEARADVTPPSGLTPCPNPLYKRIKIGSTSEAECVCAFGKLEIGFLVGNQGAEAGTSICDLFGGSATVVPGASTGRGALARLIVPAVITVTALTAIAAMVSIVIGGYFYMTAGGSADRVRTAKVWVGSAILGIIIALLAWVILNSISPNLV